MSHLIILKCKTSVWDNGNHKTKGKLWKRINNSKQTLISLISLRSFVKSFYKSISNLIQWVKVMKGQVFRWLTLHLKSLPWWSCVRKESIELSLYVNGMTVTLCQGIVDSCVWNEWVFLTVYSYTFPKKPNKTKQSFKNFSFQNGNLSKHFCILFLLRRNIQNTYLTLSWWHSSSLRSFVTVLCYNAVQWDQEGLFIPMLSS